MSKLNRIDVYRDGGSLSISFSDRDNQEFALIFKIDLSRDHIASGRKYYKDALLESFTKRSYTSPVTHDTLPLPPDVNRESITWKEALVILEDARQLLGRFDSEYKWVFHAMVGVAEAAGYVAGLIRVVFGTLFSALALRLRASA